MKRDQLIEIIDGIDPANESALDDLCIQLQSRAKTQAAHASWASDLEQSFYYILIALFPVLCLIQKKIRRSIRLNLRSFILAFLVGTLLLIELIVLVVISMYFSDETNGLIGFSLILIIEFAIFGSWFERIKRRADVNEFGLHAYCIRCRCKINGQNSRLGERVKVGPRTCPKCGCLYPAIS